MEVILKRNFNKLGYKNDIVKVKDGYALNFLIPRNIAGFATESEKKVAQENIKQGLKKQEKMRNEALDLSKKIEGTTLTFEVNCDKNGEISQAISSVQIVNKLKQQFDFDFHKNSIIFDKKINKLGKYNGVLTIFRDVVANISIEIKKTKSE